MIYLFRFFAKIDESGEIHLSEGIRKIRISSDKWNEQGVLLYNLDVVIAVGYRVNSYEATQFRIWATKVFLYGFDNSINDHAILPDAGSISHEQAEGKALGEYEKYRMIQDQTFLSDFDRLLDDLDTATSF